MIVYRRLYRDLNATRLHRWVPELRQQLDGIFDTIVHGRHEEWENVLQQLPELKTSHIHPEWDCVTTGVREEIPDADYDKLYGLLKQLQPWRKGPYELFGIHIDTEWRSDWKWQRIKDHLSPLQDRLVLDIGCGSGYHMWRMLGAGAKLVIGVDPSRLFLTQFNAIKHYMGQELPIHLLPLRGEDLPDFQQQGFDTVFSMGVLYHRKSPFNHLQELKSFLKPGGEMVLETLVIEGDENSVLVPEDRYAKMRNVWFIPSVPMLERWLRRLGFVDIKVADVNQTTVEEQRSTDWMGFESLPDFLHADDSGLTVEGYPAPLRACLVCRVSG